ncbi:hypothetical protein FRC12_010325, partial [Ceratobasidium sp. 428]
MDLVAATLVVAALTVDFIVILRFVAAVLFYGRLGLDATICCYLFQTPSYPRKHDTGAICYPRGAGGLNPDCLATHGLPIRQAIYSTRYRCC